MWNSRETQATEPGLTRERKKLGSCRLYTNMRKTEIIEDFFLTGAAEYEEIIKS
jgi:hypothetical protein